LGSHRALTAKYGAQISGKGCGDGIANASSGNFRGPTENPVNHGSTRIFTDLS
jgi:hypothetical protein